MAIRARIEIARFAGKNVRSHAEMGSVERLIPTISWKSLEAPTRVSICAIAGSRFAGSAVRGFGARRANPEPRPASPRLRALRYGGQAEASIFTLQNARTRPTFLRWRHLCSSCRYPT